MCVFDPTKQPFCTSCCGPCTADNEVLRCHAALCCAMLCCVGVMYTCDAFGLHYCTEDPFDTDVSAIMPHYRYVLMVLLMWM